MKKLALLQLLLLPLAGLAEGPKFADASAVIRSEPSVLEVAWHASETGMKSFAKRLVGFSYAQTANHAGSQMR